MQASLMRAFGSARARLGRRPCIVKTLKHQKSLNIHLTSSDPVKQLFVDSYCNISIYTYIYIYTLNIHLTSWDRLKQLFVDSYNDNRYVYI